MDLKQTHQTLMDLWLKSVLKQLRRSSREPKDLLDELGDVLLQVVLHSQLANESNNFSIKDVLQNISEKMIVVTLMCFQTRQRRRKPKEEELGSN